MRIIQATIDLDQPISQVEFTNERLKVHVYGTCQFSMTKEEILLNWGKITEIIDICESIKQNDDVVKGKRGTK